MTAPTQPTQVPAGDCELSRGDELPTRSVRFAHGGTLTLAGSRARFDAEFPAVDRLYWRREGERLSLSRDLRRLLRGDERPSVPGLVSLLLFGACVPPFTLFEGIESAIPGFRTEFDLRTLSVDARPQLDWPSPDERDRNLDDTGQCDALASALDASLTECLGESGADAPVLLFSGGVDSGVLAARLAALGRQATLCHYSFDETHADTVAARALAQRFGVPLEIIRGTVGDVGDVIDRAPSRSRNPYCDHSSLPTHQLATAVASRAGNRMVLDGTGADGAFGLFGRARQYERLYALPGLVRAAGSRAYASLRLWRSAHRLEYPLRMMRRSATLPMLGASIAQHSLLGIGLRADAAALDAVHRAMAHWVDSIAPEPTAAVRLPLVDLGLVCAGVFAQKDFSHFTPDESRVRYPYLLPSMVRLAIVRARHWPGAAEPKHALKQLLLRSAPRELVYRPKSGFVSDRYEAFRDAGFLERLDRVTAARSRLGGLIDARVVRTLRDDLARERPLPAPTYNFLWAILVAESWLAFAARAGQT